MNRGPQHAPVLRVAGWLEPVPPDRQSGILPLDSATTLSISGCEGTIRTCMNRVRAGYPGQLDDLANVRREPADTVCFLDKRSNRSLHHSSNFSPLLRNELPPLLTSQTGCRGAIRTPVPGFKVQSPAPRTTRHHVFSGIAFMHRTHKTADSSTLWPCRLRSVRARSTRSR